MDPNVPAPLATRLLAHAPLALADEEVPLDEVEARLRELLGRAQAAWPGVALEAEDFVAYLGARLSGATLQQALAGIHAEDIYLACACAQGRPAALAAFDERYLSQAQVGAMLARQRATPVQIDEVRQQVREKLLLAPPDALPRITEYRGSGALLGWVRVTVVRTALNLRRNMDDQVAQRRGDDPAQLGLAGEDAEVDYLRRRYRDDFKAAFQDALRGLPAEQRNLLRMNLIDGLSIDKLGAIFGMSRATAARRLAAAREAVVAETRRLLQGRLRLSPSEIQGLWHACRQAAAPKESGCG
jgi:RNA polymerase sigma-70 factor (ECF subfamily)